MQNKFPGYLTGWHGSAGRHEPGADIRSKSGSGRAAQCRSYTVSVKRVADGVTRTKTIGPAYHPKKVWQRLRDEAMRELINEIERSSR